MNSGDANIARMDVDPRFATIMLGLAEVFRQPLTEQRIKLYAQALGDLQLTQVEHAAQRAIRECRYFPTPKELREFVEVSADDAALLAWAGFQRAASEVGIWASLHVEDSAAAEALAAVFGGWTAYCEAEGPAVGARKAEFLAAYRHAARRWQATPRGQSVCIMSGLCERGWVGKLTADGDVKRLSGPEERRGLPEAREAQDDEG